MNGVQITQETARYSDNLLNSFCNFNSVHSWNKVSGGSNVGIIENSTQNKYAGLRAIKIPFIGTSECIFNAGGSQMQQTITKSGLHLLSCRFYKENVNTEVILKLQMYVNGNLLPQNEIEQSLSSAFGFVDSQWNTFYQEVNLEVGDVVDFAFSVQADTVGFNLYIDGLKLEKNDRNLNVPSVYSEVPIEVVEQENTLLIPIINAGSSYIVTFVLPNAKLGTDYIVMKYPNSLITQGLLVGTPTLTADGVGKFIIFNPTGSNSTAINDAIFKFKVVK